MSHPSHPLLASAPARHIAQVEFQRQLRAGRSLFLARGSPEGCGCFDDEEVCRLRVSRGVAAALALAYAILDAALCSVLAVAFVLAAWAAAVEADGTVAPEWRGMHAALTAVGVLMGTAAGVRVLAAVSVAAYLRVSQVFVAFFFVFFVGGRWWRRGVPRTPLLAAASSRGQRSQQHHEGIHTSAMIGQHETKYGRTLPPPPPTQHDTRTASPARPLNFWRTQARSRLVYVLAGREPPWHYAMSPLMQRLALRQACLFVACACLLLVVGAGSYVWHWTVDTEGELRRFFFFVMVEHEKGSDAIAGAGGGDGIKRAVRPSEAPHVSLSGDLALGFVVVCCCYYGRSYVGYRT